MPWIAGESYIEDRYFSPTTQRHVSLRVYPSEEGLMPYARFAFYALKCAIVWYEEKFQRPPPNSIYEIKEADQFLTSKRMITSEQYKNIFSTIAVCYFYDHNNTDVLEQYLNEQFGYDPKIIKQNQLQTLIHDIIFISLDQCSLQPIRNTQRALLNMYKHILLNDSLPYGLKAELLKLPCKSDIIARRSTIDIDMLNHVYDNLEKLLALKFNRQWVLMYQFLGSIPTQEYTPQEEGARQLKSLCLHNLMILGLPAYIQQTEFQLRTSKTLTNKIAALVELFTNKYAGCAKIRARSLDFVKNEYHNTPVFDQIMYILVREVARNNLRLLHHHNGSGYDVFAQSIVYFSKRHPNWACALLDIFTEWRKFDTEQQKLIARCLNEIIYYIDLPDIVYDKAKTILAMPSPEPSCHMQRLVLIS